MQFKSLLRSIGLTMGLCLLFSVCHAQGLVDTPFGWATSGGSVTGGGNAAPVTVTSNSAFRSAVSGSSPKVVYVSGTIDLGVANMANIGSNTTLVGLGNNATLLHGGIKLSGVSNVIIRNLFLKDARDPNWQCETPTEGGQPSNCTSSNAEYDLLVIQSRSSRIWIDHCSFENHQTNELAYDGQLDIKNGSDYITVSYCVFSNSRKTNLIGSSNSDTGNYRITWAYNWWNGTRSRNPMIRHGRVHMLNNYFSNIGDYAIGVRINSRIYAERNYFLNVRRPSTQGDASGQIQNVGNAFVNSNPNSFDGQVSSVGWTPPYSYTALSAGQVPSHVQANAGAGKLSTGGGGGGSGDPSCGTCGSGIVDGGVYRITPRHAQDKALELYDFNSANGANVNQWSYWGGEYQHWVAEDRGSGYWSFHPLTATGRAMDVWNISPDNGANIAIWDYWGGPGQRWSFANAGSGGWVRIISENSGKCLDVEGSSAADGANLLQWDCIGNAQNQMFRFQSVSGNLRLNTFGAATTASPTASGISLFPNPTTQTFEVLLPEAVTDDVELQIFSGVGQLVRRQPLRSRKERIDVADLQAGVYWVEVRGAHVSHQQIKLIKQ
ncbi:RICIN domain-containing protein [Lewinella sp. IMCC34191]|uniref:pectate lyase family protein n=1 Tax=Lewinella sp. IMCC34191 TaxID=2259172 RepID=UPI000E225669|nr:RICIN domain-containing protein [Lewinella sp. IMCC34191]